MGVECQGAVSPHSCQFTDVMGRPESCYIRIFGRAGSFDCSTELMGGIDLVGEGTLKYYFQISQFFWSKSLTFYFNYNQNLFRWL